MAGLLALLSSVAWGTADFMGGRAARTAHVLHVLAWAQLASLLVMWTIVGVGAASGWLTISRDVVLVAAVGGVAGISALAAFYRALAIGPMGVVPPIAALGVAGPVTVGLLRGDAPTAGVLVGIVIAVAGVVLAATSRGSSQPDPEDSRTDVHGSPPPLEARNSPHGASRLAPATLALSLGAALGFGVIFIALDAAAGASARDAVVATAGVRLGSCCTILLAVAILRLRPLDVPRRARVGYVGIGLLDTLANLLFALAAVAGALEVVAVLGSLYPAVTSALAHLVLGERLDRMQLAGVLLVMCGVILLVVA